MGSGRWSSDAWKNYSSTHVNNKKDSEIFSSRSLNKDLDPKGVTRESCDSASNPNSTPIIIGLDVTGSMGEIAVNIARKGLAKLATEIYDRKPVPDPHILFAGIGDVKFDRVPFQATQFEADIRIVEQLTKIFVEGGGGGNSTESYTLPWWFAGMHTKCDNFIKRGKKGYLFTMGDEQCPRTVLANEIEKVFGDKVQVSEYTAEELLDIVSKQYEVFHIVIEEGYHMRYHSDEVMKSWREVLGQRVLTISDYTKLPELIVSTLQVMNGESVDDVANSWDGSTGLVIKNSIKDLSCDHKGENGLVTFD